MPRNIRQVGMTSAQQQDLVISLSLEQLAADIFCDRMSNYEMLVVALLPQEAYIDG